MPIPQDVLAVNRPKNTVVIAYGKNKVYLSNENSVKRQFKIQSLIV